MLHNYRVRSTGPTKCAFFTRELQILNITGFRKALKKFEKVTKVRDFLSISIQHPTVHLIDPRTTNVHDREGMLISCSFFSCCLSPAKVEASALGSDKMIRSMMEEMVTMYAARFGNVFSRMPRVFV